MAQSAANEASSQISFLSVDNDDDNNNSKTNNDNNFTLLNSRRPFHRQPSYTPPSRRYQHVALEDQDIAEAENAPGDSSTQGLGLSYVRSQNPESPVIKRVPVATRPYASPPTSPEFEKPFQGYSQTTTAQNTGEAGTASSKWPSAQSSRLSLKEPAYQHIPAGTDLLPHDHGAAGCPTKGDVLKSQWTWFTTMIVVLASYSTVFSAIFLVIALAKPHWGHGIGTKGALSYGNATLLSALFSKTVELAFATTFVAMLGQVLSRRAFARNTFSKASGMSLGEVNMRLWVMQPGTLLTHWTGARYAITTMLGISALTAAVATALYTTACESLVAPKLTFTNNETRILFGEFSTSYANSMYLKQKCKTPITSAMDGVEIGGSCLQIDYAGNGFRNLHTWMAAWDDRSQSHEGVTALQSLSRPPPVAILYENTTVHGQWIRFGEDNMTVASLNFGRLVQNVSLVMPHANIVHAAKHPKNRILQPDDLQGAGEYHLQAAVPAPALNVMCAGATEEELLPLIKPVDTPLLWPPESTVLDDVFGWTAPDSEQPPLFSKLPMAYNTVGNMTALFYGQNSVWLLANTTGISTTPDYVLCGIKSFQALDCSTAYHVANSGGRLSVHCADDTVKWKSYREVADPQLSAATPAITDWRDVAAEWLRAVALTHGETNGNASSARLMTQMTPGWTKETGAKPSDTMPTIGEALGVLASYTLLLSSDAAPFIHWFDHETENNIFEQPVQTNFSADLSYKNYASGPDHPWQAIFYLILWIVFLQNCFCLAYLLWHFIRHGEVTDYTEPQNLFALAINSPPSAMLAGSCGGGPSGEMLGRRWCVDMSQSSPASTAADHDPNTNHNQNHTYDPKHSTTPSHPHFFVRFPDEDRLAYSTATTPSPTLHRFDMPSSPAQSKHVSFSPLVDFKRRSRIARPKSMQNFQDYALDESPAVAQYRALVGR